jgi:hypothetical protein
VDTSLRNFFDNMQKLRLISYEQKEKIYRLPFYLQKDLKKKINDFGKGYF